MRAKRQPASVAGRMPPRQQLPIDAVLGDLTRVLAEHRRAVVLAPTGAGKTTRVPPALLEASTAGIVYLLEPRRVAARAAARRMAWELGEAVGATVGYDVRFERRLSEHTRIVVLTEGMLLRRLQRDPFLEDATAVVFDEFHERSLDADLALAMVCKVADEVRPELGIVVMSATLDPGPVSAFLGDCPVLRCEGRLHPVAVEYRPGDERTTLEGNIRRATLETLERSDGDILVFLPGVGEIRRCRRALEGAAPQVELCELYGDLPGERQDAALRRGQRRKVVLATNVAETSVTIEGITAVVDSGLQRLPRFDAAAGLDRLELARISAASADQRAGRAGRTGPGLCLRLWSAHDQRSLQPRQEPEIRRVDLCGAVLALRAWGEAAPARFRWLEAPEPAAVERAEALLEELGAVDSHGLTRLGDALARLPVAVRLAGQALGVGRRAALAAALLSERDPWRSGCGLALSVAGGTWESDLLDRVLAIERFELGRDRAADVASLGWILRARDQLTSALERLDTAEPNAPDLGPDEALLQALLAAFPDRVARRRKPHDNRAVMVGGRGLRLAEESSVRQAQLFLALDVDAGRRGRHSEAVARLASAIEPEWLAPEGFRRERAVSFDRGAEHVVAVERDTWRGLVLAERRVPPGAEEASQALLEAALEDPAAALAGLDKDAAALIARITFLAAAMPELGLQPDTELGELLPGLVIGRRSFAELRKAPLEAVMLARLDWRQRQALETHAPASMEVPSGRHIPLRYEPGRAPVLAARIQEFFGLAAAPTVADGRVRVLIELLAPNGRPQQTTDDLAGFWERTYPQVRAQLRGRYPKHAWPEDPRSATPTARARPRR
jgi:ATP-dependent helicase HrpB